MAGELHISRLGAKIVEGVANGFKLSEMHGLFGKQEGLRPNTFRDQFRLAYQELGVESTIVKRPGNRAIAMSIASGLMRATDLKRPGGPFIFTMQPDEDCAIQYRTTSRTQSGRSDDLRLRRLGTTQARVGSVVPGSVIGSRALTISAEIASFTSASLWGLSGQEIVDQGLASPGTKRTIWDAIGRTGLRTLPQFAAHCAVNGALHLPQEIMDPHAMQPTSYTEPRTLLLPLGVVPYLPYSIPPSV